MGRMIYYVGNMHEKKYSRYEEDCLELLRGQVGSNNNNKKNIEKKNRIGE